MMYSLLKETKPCQVCKKSFSNGNALRGHMRSHHTRKLSTESSPGSITPSLRPCNNLGANFKPHETVLMRSVRTSDVVGGRTPDLNKECEQQITTAARRKIVIDLEEVTSTESPYSLTVEQCALCLLQMKGTWPENRQNPKSIDSMVSTRKRKDTKEDQDDSSDDEYVVEDEETEEGDVKFLTSSDMGYLRADNNEDDGDYADEKREKKQSKYTCDICGKVLRSYQALGGHRKSHGNKRLKTSKRDGAEVVRRHYECHICKRVFKSGQALGGHMKSHYAFLQPNNLSTSIPPSAID